MPIYEYQCRKCKHRFERIQTFSDPPIKKCPQCRGGRVEKLLSSPAFHFKGSGWYVTDYARKGSGGKGKDKDDKEGAKESAKDSGKESVKEGDKKTSTGDSPRKSSSGKKDRKS